MKLFHAAVAAADPARVIVGALPPRPRGRTVVIGAGKASASMAAAFEQAYDGPLSGVVVTPYGHAETCERIRIMEAAHPVPDMAGLSAARALFEAVEGLTADDLVVALISGGGSALLPAPAEGLALADEIAVNEALLASGVPISAMNSIRKQLSRIKGGRLALAAYPAPVVTLILSDIPGDDPALVASGPTIADSAGVKDALRLVEAWGVQLPERVMQHLASGADPAPDPRDPRFSANSVRILASSHLSLEAAAKTAEAQGIEAAILSDAIEGEARDVAGVHAAIALEVAQRNRPFKRPVLMLSGGETTVTLRGGGGVGGRNTEFALALALRIQGFESIHAFAADTDGIDGTGGNAGAFVNGATVSKMHTAGIDPVAALAANNSWHALHAVQGLFVTGPTGTNVNDIRAVLVT